MTDTPTLPTPEPRHAKFESLAYGLFLHWGLYSQKNQGEWFYNYIKPPMEEYVKLQESFTAADFDARAWARLARQSGFRYVCHTTRHHEGFSLYDTRGLNKYDAPHSPAGRDLVGEIIEACRAEDLGVFLYHTTLDWWHPDFDTDWDAYLDYLNASVEILCTQYGQIDGLWFDGNWARRQRDWKEDKLYGMIRKHQPECIIVNNSSINALGAKGHPELDVITFEQGRPEPLDRTGMTKYSVPEMCETINSHWGIARDDYSHKAPAQLIESLAACRSAGANFLLNVGPTATGGIPPLEEAILRSVGRWIETQGASIYAGRPGPFTCRGQDFVLKHDDGFTMFIHDLPIHGNMHLSKGAPRGDGLQTIAGDLPKIQSVRWSDNGEALEFSQDGEKGMLTFLATPNPYGRQVVVRSVDLIPA